MAVVYLTELAGLAATTQGDSVPLIAEPGLLDQTIALTSASAQSAAFGANTQYIALSSDSIFSAAYGANPSATLTNLRHAAGMEYIRKVTPGQKIAVILNT